MIYVFFFSQIKNCYSDYQTKKLRMGKFIQSYQRCCDLTLFSYNKQIMNKNLKKKPYDSITELHCNLFGKLDAISIQANGKYSNTEALFVQFQQTSKPYEESLLQKAKKITYSNKGKIQKMRNEIRKLQQAQSGDFLTGVGLYNHEQKVPQHQYDVDEDKMMKDLRNTKYDDLQELRRMIKKTQNNLREYSQSLYNVQSQIVSAADKYGQQLDVGLSIRINRCGLDSTHSNFKKTKGPIATTQSIKKRTMSSYNARRNRF